VRSQTTCRRFYCIIDFGLKSATRLTSNAPGDFKAIVKAASNLRDREMLHVLFEAALRPGELPGMKVGGVEFKKDYCIITGAEEPAKALVENRTHPRIHLIPMIFYIIY
jgi:hypothetical protein